MKPKLRILFGSLLIAGIGMGSPAHSQFQQIWVVCHGEFENICRKHSYNKWEECSDKNGVKGPNPALSCLTLCAKPMAPGSCAAQKVPDAPFESGDHCGYLWFTVSCF